MSENSRYEDIIDVLEKHVRKLAKNYWKDDDCPPKFFVSLDNEDPHNQSILLTINNGYKFTERLFPRDNTQFGYESIFDQMINMYYKTV